MSTTVDERVVEMRFDNRDFEKNVSTSMSTLEKLKQKLNLTGASKNLDELNRAAKRVDFSPVSNSLDNVVTRFSHAQMTIQHQIDRYMDKLVMMGERAVKALTIDPIKTGFQEYETQINSVQTIWSNTKSKGTTLDDVNKALDELNTYADKTIYNFTEMTRNIGTFTAAGVELDTSVNAIQGIANLAAISGSTSQQASTAMYQLSQALASGTVKLMDWNSVVNAGMGGEVFQNALKETARVHGVAIDKMIEEQGSFRETLSDGWLTSEILTETLQKFTLTTEGLTDAQIKANREMLKAKGYTEDQIDAIFELGKDATDAATKVKTFTQLWDVMKESAQSGWSQTWKMIVGDYEEAKNLLTPLANILTGFIGKMSDARNWIVQGVVDFTTPWTNIMKKLEGAGLLKTVQKVTDSVMDAAKKIEYYQDIVNKVWRGDYKNSDTGRYGLLDADGYNHKVVQSLVNKGYQYELTIEDIEEAEKKFGITIGETAKSTEEMGNVIANLSDEQLRNAGLTEEEIRLYRDLEKYAKESGISIDELAKKMSENDGRTLLIDSFKNIGNSIIAIFKAIGQAWKDVFDPISIVGIYHAIEAFNEWTKSLNLVDKNTGELNETGQKIKRTLAGVFAIVDVLTTILGGGLKIAFKIVSAVLEYFNLDLLSFTAMVGDALVVFSDWFDSIFDVSGAVKWLIDAVKKAIPIVKGWIDEFKELPFVQKVISGIKTAFASLKSIDLRDIGKWLIEGFKMAFSAEGIKIAINAVLDFGKKILTTIKDVLGIHSPSTEFFDLAIWCIKGFVNGLIAGVKYIGTGIVNIGKAIIDAFRDSGVVDGLIAGVKYIGTGIVNIGKAIIDAFRDSGVVDGIKNIFGTIKDVLSKIDFGKILAIIPIGLAIMLVKKIYDFATSFGKVVDHIGDILENAADAVAGFAKLLKGMAFKAYTEGIKELAIAMLIMVGSVALLTLLDTDKLYDAVAIILVLSLILGALAFAVGQMSKASASFKKGEGLQISGLTSSLASIGLAILMLAASIKLIGSMNPETFKQGMIGMAAIIAGLVIVLAAFKGLGDNKSAENIDKVGKMIFKLSLSMLLLVGFCKLVGKLEWSEMGKAAVFAVAFMAFVSILSEAAYGRGSDADKIGKMIFKLSLSMILLVGFCKLAGKLERDELIKGGLFAAGFVAFVGLLVAVTKIGSDQALAKLGGMLLSITLSMLLMIGVAKLLGKLELKDVIAGAAFMLAFIGFAWLLTKVTTISNKQKSAKIAGSILAIAVAVAALAVVSVLMSMLTPEGIIKGVGAVVALSLGMAAMIAATKGVSKSAMKTVIALVAAVAVMAIIVGVFASMDTSDLLAATASLSLLMGMFTALIKVTKVAKNSKAMTKTIWSMIAVVAALGGLLAGLAFVVKYTGNGAILAAAGALSTIMLAFSAAMVIIGKTGRISSTVQPLLVPMLGVIAVLGGVLAALGIVSIWTRDGALIEAAVALGIVMNAFAAAMVIIGHTGRISATVQPLLLPMLGVVAGLAAIMAALSIVTIWTGSGALLAAATSLSMIMLALSASMVIISYASPTINAALPAVGIMLLVVAGLAAILALMTLLPNVDSTLTIANALSRLLLSLSVSMVIMSVAGILAGPAAAGIALMTAVIVGVGALALAIGALMEKFPGLQDFLNTGLPILEQIAESLGTCIGNFVSGAMTAIVDALPNVGTKLSEFMEKAQGFFDGASALGQDGSVVEGAKAIVAAIIAVTAAELIDGIASFLGIEGDFTTFKEKLVSFGEAMAAFSAAVTGKIDEGAVTAAASAGGILVELQKSLYGEGGLKQSIFGEKNLDDFADEIVAFGEAMVDFSDEVAGNIDSDAVTAAANAGKILAELQKSLYGEGGLKQDIFGEKDLEDFGDQLVDFGEAIVDFSEEVDGKITEGAIKAAANAGMMMAELQEQITPIGGVVGFFTGDNSLDTFGEQIEDFGESITGFAEEVEGLDENDVKAAANAGLMMADLQEAIPEDKWLDGKMSLDDFGKTIVKFGEKMIEFSETCADLKSDKIEVAATIASKLNGMLANFASSKTEALSYFDDNDLTGFMDGLINVQLKANGLNDETLNSFIDTANNFATSVSNFATIDTTGVTTFKNVIDELKTIDVSGLESFDVDVSGLENVASTIVVTISNGMSTRADTIKNTLLSIMDLAANSLSVKNEVYQAKASALLGNMILGFNSKKEAISTSVKGIITDIATSISNGGKSFHDAGANLIDNMIATFGSAANKMEIVGGNLMKAIVSGMNTNKGSLKNTVTGITNDMGSVLKSKNKLFQQSGTDIVKNLMNGIKSQTPGLIASLKTAVATSAVSLTSHYTSFYNAGSYLVDGFTSGISANSYKAAAQAAAMAEAAKEAAEEALGINSPSKVFYGIGDYTGQGFVNALADYATRSYKAGSAMADSARKGLTNAIGKATDMLAGKADMQPTIRPVVDLSGVESGTSAINSMLNLGSRIGISANVGAVSSMMSRRNQNGANSEIVAAIDRLDKHLDNVGSTSYNVNGITYDDGSNVKEAVEALVRAARIERRV